MGRLGAAARGWRFHLPIHLPTAQIEGFHRVVGTTRRRAVTPEGAAVSSDQERIELYDRMAKELYVAVVSDILDGLGLRNQVMRAEVRPIDPTSKKILVGRAATTPPAACESRVADAIPVRARYKRTWAWSIRSLYRRAWVFVGSSPKSNDRGLSCVLSRATAIFARLENRPVPHTSFRRGPAGTTCLPQGCPIHRRPR